MLTETCNCGSSMLLIGTRWYCHCGNVRFADKKEKADVVGKEVDKGGKGHDSSGDGAVCRMPCTDWTVADGRGRS